jgi:DNA-binding Lrp family transcriptional regulator
MSKRGKLRILQEPIVNQPNTNPFLSFDTTYAGLRLQLDEELGTYHGIDFADFALLHSLASDVNCTTGLDTIAVDLGTSRPALLRRLRPLEKTGLIACHGGIEDRRIALRAPALSLMKTAHETIDRVCARPSLAEPLKKLNDALLVYDMLDDVQIELNGQ